MSWFEVPAGQTLPEEFNVIVESPMNGDPIKYEIDKESGAVFVDRFLSDATRYPCNYGYVPRTINAAGDTVGVLLVAPFPLYPGVVVTCRAIGMLRMNGERSQDHKLVAVPINKLTRLYENVNSVQVLPEALLTRISDFLRQLEPENYL